ncbi:MAG: sulfatase [Terriglobales bacterium]
MQLIMSDNNNSRLLVLGAWFGLVAGLVEGLGLLAVFGYGWLTPNNVRAGVTAEIIWISALVNLGLFVLLALCGMLVQKLLPKVEVPKLLVPLFLFVACVDWLALSGRLGPIAVLSLAAGIAVTFNRWFQKHTPNTLSFLHRTLPVVVAIAVVAFLGVQGTAWSRERVATAKLPPAAPGSPNVLVVVIDTLRADHLALYGYNRETTPHLDAIAKQGVVFDNDISPSPWTLGSHASMLTGRYPHEHGVDHEVALGTTYPTLPEVFARSGYRTGGVSANLYYFARRTGLTRGFIHFDDYFYSAGDMFYRTLWGRIVNKYAPDSPRFDELFARKRAPQVNQELLRWIDQDRSKPFFAFINYFDVHEPYQPLDPYRKMFNQDDTNATPPQIDQRINRKEHPYLYRLSHMSPQDFQHQVDAYDGATYYVDEQIANLLAELGKRGLSQNTLIVVTSDHGECFGDHGLLAHWNALYREVLRVPLIYYWPGKIPAGVRVDKAVSAASLPATVLELAGIKPDVVFPIPSVVQLWQQPGVDPAWPDPLAEIGLNSDLPESYPAYQGWLKAIVGPQWHLIISEKLPPELYDWKADPKELNNRAASGDQEALKTMSTKLWNEVASRNPPEQVAPYASPVASITK